MLTDRYYRHSGSFAPFSVAKALGAGVLVAVPMAFVYSYAILYIPIVGTISFVLTGGFAAVVGSAVGWMMHAGKVRNNAATLATATVVGLFTLWISWVTWVFALLRRADGDVSLSDLAFDPAALWRVMNIINEKGAWNLKGFTPTGAILWGLWALEAAIIFGAIAAITWEWVNSPFCEKCDQWCLEQKAIAVLGHTGKDALVPRLEKGEYAVVAEMTDPTELAFTRFDLHQCGSCRAVSTLSATAVTVTLKKGKYETSEKTLMKYLLLPPGDLATLKAIVEEKRARSAAAEAAA